MLLTVINGQGQLQTVIVCSQENPTDKSGVITATGTPQILLDANASRSGWFIQNTGDDYIYVNELGGVPSEDVGIGAGSFAIAPTACFPPPGFPLTTSQINIVGTADTYFVAREW